MRCPAADGELINHTTQGEKGLTVSYSTCASCRGYWMDSFAANFIKIHTYDTIPTHPVSRTYHCPVCTAQLQRTSGNNVPDNVFVFDCPAHHGYFFPVGQLAAFKKAQKTKIDYHKLWNIPMPNISGILLSGLVLLLLSGGLVITFQGLQQRQTMESQAKEILITHDVYATPHTVLITATTGSDAAVTVHIPHFRNFSSPLESTDHRMHQLTIQNIAAGTYRYFFTIDVSGKEIQSDTFTFTVLP